MVTPTLHTALAARSEAEREWAFWQSHFDEYLAKYGDQFVAVADDEVVASAADLESLTDILRREGIGMQGLWVRFIAS